MLKVLLCSLALTGYGVETDEALLQSMYRGFEAKSVAAGNDYPMGSEECEWLFERGPAVLPLIFMTLEAVDDTTDIDSYVTLFEYCSRASLYDVTTNPRTANPRGSIHLQTDEDDLLAIPNNTGLRMARWPSYVREHVLAWRNKAPRILQNPNAADSLLRLPIRLPLHKIELTPEIYARIHRMQAYGIYNLPRFVRMIAEGENGFIFQQFLIVARARKENSGVFGGIIEKAQTVAQRFPTLESRLNVVRTWWREDSWKYEVLPDLYKAIQAEMDRLEKAGSE